MEAIEKKSRNGRYWTAAVGSAVNDRAGRGAIASIKKCGKRSRKLAIRLMSGESFVRWPSEKVEAAQ